MNTVTFSVIFMITVFVVIIGVDIILAQNKLEGDTFSEIIREKNKKWAPLGYMIVFGMGLLTGHWFW